MFNQINNPPIDALGNKTAELVNLLSKTIQAPEGLCFQSVLAAINLAVQHIYNLKIDSRTIGINNFFLSVALSGERKTACDKIVFSPHRTYQKEKLSSLDKTISLNPKTDMQLTPNYDSLICDDVTFEGISNTFARGSTRLGIVTSEGGIFFGGFGMNKENRTKMVSGLSKFWDDEPVNCLRAYNGQVTLYNRKLMIHIQIQPELILSYAKDRLFWLQGFFSRFLMIWPESTQGNRVYSSVDIMAQEEFQFYKNRIQECLATESDLNQINKNQIKHLILSVNARQTWINNVYSFYESLLLEKHHEYLRPFISKAPEHVLRIAGSLFTFENRDIFEISEDYILRANKIVDYYFAELNRIIKRLDSKENSDGQLLNWLKSNPTKNDIRTILQYGPSHFRKKEIITAELNKLLEQNLVKTDGQFWQVVTDQ